MFDGTMGRLLLIPESPLNGKGPSEMKVALHVCRSFRSGRESGVHSLEQRTVKPLPAPVVDHVADALGAVQYLEIGTEEPKEVPASLPESYTDPSMEGVEKWITNVGNGGSKVEDGDRLVKIANTSNHWDNHTPEPWGDNEVVSWKQPVFSNGDNSAKVTDVADQNWNGICQDAGSSWDNHESSATNERIAPEPWEPELDAPLQNWQQEAETESQDWYGPTNEDEIRSFGSMHQAASVISHSASMSKDQLRNADADDAGSVQSIYRAPSVVSRPQSTRSFHTAQTRKTGSAARGTSSNYHSFSPGSNRSRSMRSYPSANGDPARYESASPQKRRLREAGKFSGQSGNGRTPKRGQQRPQKDLEHSGNTHLHPTHQSMNDLIDLESTDDPQYRESNWTTVENRNSASRGAKRVDKSETSKKPTNAFQELADLDFFSSPDASSSSQPSSGDAKIQRPPDNFLNGKRFR